MTITSATKNVKHLIIIKHKNESDENVIQIKIIESILYR